MAIEGYDLVMLGILAAAAVLGYLKGMVWQVAWIAGIAASTFVALRFGSEVAPYVGQQPPWNRLIAMLALYVATSLAVWLVFRVISGAINAVHLSAFDRQLGLVLGLAKGALLCVVITFFSVTLAPAYRHQIVGSRSGRLVAELIVRADEFLPREIGEAVDPFVRQFEDQFRDGQAAGPQATTAATPSPSAGSVWNVVTSAAAWIGPGAKTPAASTIGVSGQGGPPGFAPSPGQAPGATVTPGVPWGMPAGSFPAVAAVPPPTQPSAQLPAQPFAGPMRGQPAPGVPVYQQQMPQPQAPSGYPLGAQTRLPPR